MFSKRIYFICYCRSLTAPRLFKRRKKQQTKLPLLWLGHGWLTGQCQRLQIVIRNKYVQKFAVFFFYIFFSSVQPKRLEILQFYAGSLICFCQYVTSWLEVPLLTITIQNEKNNINIFERVWVVVFDFDTFTL